MTWNSKYKKILGTMIPILVILYPTNHFNIHIENAIENNIFIQYSKKSKHPFNKQSENDYTVKFKIKPILDEEYVSFHSKEQNRMPWDERLEKIIEKASRNFSELGIEFEADKPVFIKSPDTYNSSDLLKIISHLNANDYEFKVLFSAQKGDVRGKAYRPGNSAIVYDTYGEITETSDILTHELGHNLGCHHDFTGYSFMSQKRIFLKKYENGQFVFLYKPRSGWDKNCKKMINKSKKYRKSPI
ncbi:MAG: M12 family metallo-peptidase [Candidatus Aenigmatarchaeota archaeon]